MKINYTLLLLVAAVTARPVTVIAQVNTRDSLALVNLYNATNGPNWHYKWILTKPVATWPGVSVSSNRVTGLFLFQNRLKGTIPASLGNLTKLTSFELGNDSLSGTIPATIGNLKELTKLSLDQNQLSGAIPATIGNCTSLQFLSLSNNRLTSIPASIGNLVNLYGLYLHNNLLAGAIPASMGNLVNLNSLYLSHNLLTHVPSSFANLTKLTILVLGYNSLSGSIPPALGDMTNLYELILDHNQFTGSIPASLGNIAKLWTLSLNDNQLSGGIPPFFGNLISMRSLSLQNNKLSGAIPGEISNVGSNVTPGYYTSIDLSNNQLGGSIPDSFGYLVNTNILLLNNNKLTGSIPSTLGNLTNLTKLNLSGNRLTGTIPSALADLTNLTTLNLSYNKLSGNAYFGYIDKLPVLNLSHNHFTFDGMEQMASYGNKATFNDQAIINIHKSGNIFSVYAGGTLANNVYKWYRNDTLVKLVNGDSTYKANRPGAYTVRVTNLLVKQTKLILYGDTINYATGKSIYGLQVNMLTAEDRGPTLLTYPNPAKNNVAVNFTAYGKYTLILSNISGKILQIRAGVSLNATNQMKLDISSLSSGIYLVSITDESKQKRTVKLSKE